MVAIALNKPFATRSISSSICCSLDVGELRIEYVVSGTVVSVGGDVAVIDGGGGGGGRRENNDGEGAMKERY